MTSSVAGPRRSSKTVPKAKLAPKNRSWSLFGGPLPVWSTIAFFLNPRKTSTSEMYAQKVDEMHQKMQCLQPALVNRKSAIFPQNSTQPHITQPSPTSTTSSSMSTAFFRENASTTTWRQKINAFQEFVKSWSKDFYATGINRLTSCWQKCDLLTVMVPILTTNDVFEPSYNDLKFMVWNDNYICTN